MKSVSISGSLRENVGKKDAKAQRNQGMIPCVIYGGKDQKMFVVDERQFKNILYTPEVKYAEVNIDGDVRNAIVQETQFHPITDRLLHVDFLQFLLHNLKIEVAAVPPSTVLGVAVYLIKHRRNRLVLVQLPESNPGPERTRFFIPKPGVSKD